MAGNRDGMESHEVSEAEILRIGTILRNDKQGGFVSIDVNPERRLSILFFTAVPEKNETAFVHDCCVFAISSRKEICKILEMYERYHNERNVKWSAKVHGDGRVTASCSASGFGRPSRSVGIRVRVSKKQDCPARVKMRDLLHGCSDSGGSRDIEVSVRSKIKKAVLRALSSEQEQSTAAPTSLLFVTSTHFNNTCAEAAVPVNGNLGGRPVFSSTEALETRDIRDALEDFLSIPGRRTRGNVASATSFLQKKLPGVVVSESVVRNTMLSIKKNESDAEDLVRFLQSERDSPTGSVEYLHVGTNDDGALDYCSWSPVGSRSIVERYGNEVGTVDSTHKTTKYALKLFSWIIPDCTGRSRPVLFVLLQDENVTNFQAILSDYMRAFSLRLPSVIFSDNCHAFSLALSDAPGNTVHILCIWHLLDNKSVKPRVSPCIEGGASNWRHFREQFIRVRNCVHLTDFERLWMELLNKWLPEETPQQKKRNKSARRYLEREVYDLRKKWAYSFFRNSPTLSIQSTQRNEGWHSKLKALTSPNMTFAAKLNQTVEAISRGEQKDAINHSRHSALSSSLLLPPTLRNHLERINISHFAAQMFVSEFSSAMRLSVSPPQISGSIGHSDVQIQVKLQYGIPNTDEERASTPTVCIKVTDALSKTWEFTCPCSLQQRMLIPCKHILATMLSSVRESRMSTDANWMRVLQILKFVTDTTDDEVLLTNIVAETIGKRWCHSVAASISVQGSSVSMKPTFTITDPARQLSREDSDWLHARLRTGPIHFIVTEGKDASGEEQADTVRAGSLTDDIIKVGQSHSSFPVRSTGDGTPTAYSQFMAIAKIAAEELTKDACVLPVGHDVLRLLTNLIAATRGTTEKHGRDFFLVSDARRWLLDFVLETTVRYQEMDKHPLNRARFRSVEDGTLGNMSLVYPNDSDVTGEELRVFDEEKENRNRNAYIWRSRNLPLPWNCPGFGMKSVIDYIRVRSQGIGVPPDPEQPVRSMDETPCNSRDIPAQALQESPLPSLRTNNAHEMAIGIPDPGAEELQRDIEQDNRNDISTEEPQRPILNPSRRLMRARDPGQAGFYKTTRESKRRKLCALRAPVHSRGINHHTHGPSEIDVPRRGEGWACPDCACLKTQNSVSNVLQHWRACHRSSNDGSITPTDDNMRDAALLFQERVKRSPEKSQEIEVLWKESEDSNTMSWFRGKVTSVKPNGTRVQYDDQEICLHDFHNDVDEKWRPWSQTQDPSS